MQCLFELVDERKDSSLGEPYRRREGMTKATYPHPLTAD